MNSVSFSKRPRRPTQSARLQLSLVALAVVLCAPGSSSGQSADTSRLKPVVVSATKAAVPGASLTQAVTVISGDDLRARGVARVTDALREVPGASLVQSGSFGSVTSLFLRGGESRYTKILIDGVAVNSAGGYFDLSHLTTDNIDRIEIVRGPASVLYGADAVSGVVQIFTRRAGGGAKENAAFRAGTYATRDASLDLSTANSIGGLILGMGNHSTRGTNPFNNQYLNRTLSSSFRSSAGSVADVSLSGRYSSAEYHYPTDYTGAAVDTNSYRLQHRLTVGLDAGRSLSAAAQAHILLGSNDVSDLTEDIAVPFGSKTPKHTLFRSTGFRRTAEGRLSYFLPLGSTLTSGIEHLRERERSGNRAGAVGAAPIPTDGFVADRHNTAYYTELLGTVAERFSYNLSGRVDDNSDYGAITTYRVGTGIPLFAGVRARGSIATAFNAPAFNQLRATLYTVASPNLQPERSRSWEFGVEKAWSFADLRVSGDYFDQRFSQLIQYVNGSAPLFLGSYANLTAASSNGYEAEVGANPIRQLRAGASFTVVSPRVTSLAPGYTGSLKVGDALIRRPTHSGTLSLTYSGRAGRTIGASATYVGKRPDVDFSKFPSPTLSLPSYVRLDLSAESPIVAFPAGGGLSLTARVENALNKKYQDVIGFPSPHRVVLLGGRISSTR